MPALMVKVGNADDIALADHYIYLLTMQSIRMVTLMGDAGALNADENVMLVIMITGSDPGQWRRMVSARQYGIVTDDGVNDSYT